jgi:hypothetical protein
MLLMDVISSGDTTQVARRWLLTAEIQVRFRVTLSEILVGEVALEQVLLRVVCFGPEDGGSMFLRNDGIYPQVHMALTTQKTNFQEDILYDEPFLKNV